MAKQKKEYTCTMSPVIFEIVKHLRRNTDAAELIEITGMSFPVVYKALNFGHVLDVALERAIITFYENRAAEHAAAEVRIMNLLLHKNKK